MHPLYTIIIRCYWLGIKCGSFFNPKAKDWIQGRKNWQERLTKETSNSNKWIWVHCASVGEFEDCAQVVAELRKVYLSHKVLLTFFSPSGFNHFERKNVADLVSYLPIDTRSNASAFLDILKPEMVLFSRSELWFHFLSEVKKRKIPNFLIAALLQPKSNFIKPPQRHFFEKCYRSFDQIYCQNEETKELLSRIFKRTDALVVGNSRIDTILAQKDQVRYPEIETFVGNSLCIVVGSSLPKDEQMILKSIKKMSHLPIKWIIAPHEIDPHKISAVIEQNGDLMIGFSGLIAKKQEASVLYIDFVGGLKHIYRYADLAIIGGGFDPIGIHNVLEPSIYGVPSAFGPNHRNYPEALDLLKLNFSTVYTNQSELEIVIETHCKTQINLSQKSKLIEYVNTNGGATQKMVQDITTRAESLNRLSQRVLCVSE